MHEPFPWARRLTNIFNADAYDEVSGYTWTYLAIAMIGNFLVVFLGLLVFGWLRRVRPWWYSSKRLVNPEAVPADDLPNDSLFGWFFPLMRINEELVHNEQETKTKTKDLAQLWKEQKRSDLMRMRRSELGTKMFTKWQGSILTKVGSQLLL